MGSIDEDGPYDLVRIQVSKHLDVKAAEGMRHEEIGRRFACFTQQLVQLLRDISARRFVRRAWLAPTVSGAIVAATPRCCGDDRLNLLPVERRARSPGLIDDDRTALACAVEVQSVPVHLDQSPGRFR